VARATAAGDFSEGMMNFARRGLLKAMAALTGSTVLAQTVKAQAQAQIPAASSANPTGRTLIKGGYVVSQDAAIGEIDGADVLIEGSSIARIDRNIEASGAEIVDARNKVVLPGLIDTHRHTWETLTRSWIRKAISLSTSRSSTACSARISAPRMSISATCWDHWAR
jgi:5-methylthioadenosine/S-adenosylhomocysteine deaminase